MVLVSLMAASEPQDGEKDCAKTAGGDFLRNWLRNVKPIPRECCLTNRFPRRSNAAPINSLAGLGRKEPSIPMNMTMTLNGCKPLLRLKELRTEDDDYEVAIAQRLF